MRKVKQAEILRCFEGELRGGGSMPLFMRLPSSFPSHPVKSLLNKLACWVAAWGVEMPLQRFVILLLMSSCIQCAASFKPGTCSLSKSKFVLSAKSRTGQLQGSARKMNMLLSIAFCLIFFTCHHANDGSHTLQHSC